MSVKRTGLVVASLWLVTSSLAADPYDTGSAWALDGAYIYFYTYRHEQAELYRMSPDGSSQERLTNSDFNEWWMYPLQGGEELLIASDRDSGESFGGSNLYLLNAETGDMTNVTNVDEGQWAALAGVAPEAGYAIYSISDEFGAHAESELWILDLETFESTPYADDPGHKNIYPSVSMDGTVIAYMSVRDGQTGLYANDISGNNERQVLKIDGALATAELSPDGSQVAFTAGAWIWGTGDSAGSAGDRDIYVATLDGANVHRVTRSPSSDHSPSWSPDGKTITFTSYRFGPGEIFAIEPDGTGERNLTRTSETAE